jgi:hypothetical protein
VLYLRPSFAPMNRDFGGSPLRFDGGEQRTGGQAASGTRRTAGQDRPWHTGVRAGALDSEKAEG